jgi:hypothetical protein
MPTPQIIDDQQAIAGRAQACIVAGAEAVVIGDQSIGRPGPRDLHAGRRQFRGAWFLVQREDFHRRLGEGVEHDPGRGASDEGALGAGANKRLGQGQAAHDVAAADFGAGVGQE